MEELKHMASLAAARHIRGRSYKRNSLLKPLDIILDNLEREPKEDVRDLVRDGSARQIFDHISRVAGSNFKPGERKMAYVREYVDIFFDGILAKAHRGDVNRLLQRAKLIRSAYLIYFSDPLPPDEAAQAELDQLSEATQTSLDADA